eukprot:4591965-Pyramimonas_sp.AAC.1
MARVTRGSSTRRSRACSSASTSRPHLRIRPACEQPARRPASSRYGVRGATVEHGAPRASMQGRRHARRPSRVARHDAPVLGDRQVDKLVGLPQ